jgi:hypothetical protein
MLLSGAVRPGRMHDQTALRIRASPSRFRTRPTVRARVDSGYQGLAKEFPDQVSAPPSPRTRRATATSTPGRRPGAAIPRPGSASSTPTLSSVSGRPCAGSPDGATPTPRPILRSPVLSPTDPPSGPPADRRAPSSSATLPADHPPAEPARPARPDLNFPRGRKLAAGAGPGRLEGTREAPA